MKRKNSIWYYISNFKFSSLFIKNLLLVFVALYLPLALMCVGVYVYFQNTLFQEATLSAQNSVARIQEVVDTVQANIEGVSANTAANPAVSQFVRTDKWDRPSYEIVENIQDIMQTITLSCGEYVDSIYIYSSQNDYLLSNFRSSEIDFFSDTNWLESYEEMKEIGIQRIWGRKAVDQYGQPTTYITTAYAIPYDISRETQGVVLINMGRDWLTQMVRPDNSQPFEEFYIVDANGRILYSYDASQLGLDFEEATGYTRTMNAPYPTTAWEVDSKQSRWLTYSNVKEDGWQYIAVNSLTDYQEDVIHLKNLVFLLLILLLFISVGISYLISSKVFLPIQRIIQMMDDPKEFYDRNTAIKNNGEYNELRYITASFLRTITKTEEAEQELIHYITKLKEAQVALLQSQINPHFLYNTLQTINFMAISLTRSDNQVSRAIGMLSSMFSQMMQVDTNTIPISDEIAYSKAYLEIELLRHGHEFEVCWDLDPEIYEYVTVKLTLQPVLENAIRHGLSGVTEKGKIQITGRLEEGQVVFYVSDNGAGQNNSWIEKMNEELQDVTPLIGEHIGIRNVHQRIRLIFGNDYGLSFYKSDLGGIGVRIVIPKTKKEP